MTTREYAKNLFTKWNDEDWLNQPRFDKLFWEALNGNRAVNLIGVAPLNFTRWRKALRDGPLLATDLELKAALIRLQRRRYVYTDENTGEYLIRSRMRRDDLDKMPNSLLRGLRTLSVVDSPRFAVVLAAELDRLVMPVISTAKNKDAANRLQDALKVAWDNARTHLEDISDGMPDPIPDPFPDDFPDGMPEPIPDPISRPAETHSPPIPSGIPSPIPCISGSGLGSSVPLGITQVGGVRARGESGETAAPLDPNSPPSPFCPEHPNGTDRPCRACADARRNSESWDERITAAKRAAAEKRRQAVLDCPVCDDNGWVDTDGGVTRCPQPHSEMTRV